MKGAERPEILVYKESIFEYFKNVILKCMILLVYAEPQCFWPGCWQAVSHSRHLILMCEYLFPIWYIMICEIYFFHPTSLPPFLTEKLMVTGNMTRYKTASKSGYLGHYILSFLFKCV